MATYKRLSFTNDEEKKLIEFVKEHPALWDPNSMEYGNVSLRKYYWKSISSQMHKNANECRRKWRFVRDYYVLKRKRVPARIPDSKYASCNFLDKILRPKFIKADEILDYENDDSAMGEILEEHLLDDGPDHPDATIGSTTDNHRKSDDVFVSNEASRSSENDSTAQYLTELKYLNEMNDNGIIRSSEQQTDTDYIDDNTSDKFNVLNAIGDAEKETNEVVQPSVTAANVNKTVQEKDIDLFFQSMASTVKTFPPLLVAKAKWKVFSAINGLEMQLHQQ